MGYPTKVFLQFCFIVFLLLSSQAAMAQPPILPSSMNGSPRLGIIVVPVAFDRLERMGLSHGVQVRSLSPGGPAQVAGLRSGDLILSLDGQAAYTPERLQWLVQRARLPRSLKLEVWRDGDSLTLQVDAQPDVAKTPPPGGGSAREARQAYLGISMQPLTEDLRQSFGMTDRRGILVAEVEEGGPADQAGLRSGDVLVSMDRKSIRGIRDVYRATDFFDPGDRIDVRIVREGEEQTLSITLGGISRAWSPRRQLPPMAFPRWDRGGLRPWPEPRQQGPMGPPFRLDEMFDFWRRQWSQGPPWQRRERLDESSAERFL